MVSCPNVAQNTLSDIRDNKSYTVRKLADGRCWMTDNLYLVKTMTLTSANSNVTSNYAITGISGTAAMADGKAYDTGNTSYGAYYTWNTAVAGGAGDICPKNWRLPTGGSGGEFQLLYNFYNSYDAMTSNTGPNFTLNGHRDTTSIILQGYAGYYWSSTSANINTAWTLLLVDKRAGYDYSSVDPATSYYPGKQFGFGIRCFAK